MIKTSELFPNYETAYETATWLGILPTMELLGNYDYRKRQQASGLSHHVMLLCVDIAQKPDNVLSNIKEWSFAPIIDRQRNEMLRQIGCVTKKALTFEFETAYQIYTDQGWRQEISSYSTFGTLIDSAEEAGHYYESRILQAVDNHTDLIPAFRQNHRDINFHVGLYDSERT